MGMRETESVRSMPKSKRNFDLSSKTGSIHEEIVHQTSGRGSLPSIKKGVSNDGSIRIVQEMINDRNESIPESINVPLNLRSVRHETKTINESLPSEVPSEQCSNRGEKFVQDITSSSRSKVRDKDEKGQSEIHEDIDEMSFASKAM